MPSRGLLSSISVRPPRSKAITVTMRASLGRRRSLENRIFTFSVGDDAVVRVDVVDKVKDVEIGAGVWGLWRALKTAKKLPGTMTQSINSIITQMRGRECAARVASTAIDRAAVGCWLDRYELEGLASEVLSFR
jgi:hypothetical protein